MDTTGDGIYDDSYDTVFDSTLQFPLCIKETTTYTLCGTTCNILDWWMSATIIGGYHPDGLSEIEITQDKDGQTIAGGVIKIKWVEDTTFVPSCCNEKRYIAIFYIPPVCDQDFDKICLYSNLNLELNTYSLGKVVDVDFEFKWKGCDNEDQKFEYILVHKNYVSGVPNSRLRFYRQLNVIFLVVVFKFAV
jgi:hypothetical protein